MKDQESEMEGIPRFIVLLSLLASSSALLSARAGQRIDDRLPTPTAETRTEDVAKQREEDTAARRAHEDKNRDQAAKRRDKEAKTREDAAKRQKADDQKRHETARRRTEDGDGRTPRADRRDDDRQRQSAEPERYSDPPRPARVVFVGGYFYDPFFGPYPWWPATVYPYHWAPRFDGRAHVRLIASPKHAAVYVDGFYAGIVADFDGLFQPLPLLPGGHTIALYLDGYRTINKSVYLAPGSTLKLREDMEQLPPGISSAPPAVAPVLPPPPPGSYIDVRTPPREQPQIPAQQTGTQAPGFGVLSVRFQPPNAVVTIDGQEWLSSKPGELVLHVGVGRHVVTVGAPERPHFSTEIDVHDGETNELNVSVPPRTTN
jgi:hypothetical protein